jgi:hypothetical protein
MSLLSLDNTLIVDKTPVNELIMIEFEKIILLVMLIVMIINILTVIRHQNK